MRLKIVIILKNMVLGYYNDNSFMSKYDDKTCHKQMLLMDWSFIPQYFVKTSHKRMLLMDWIIEVSFFKL